MPPPRRASLGYERFGKNILEAGGPQQDFSPWLSMLEALSSWGAKHIVFVEAYFDESGSHQGSPVLCVAGYAMEAVQARLLEQEWRSLLQLFSLPYFRMSECAQGTRAFRPLTMPQRIEVATRAIGIIKRRARRGFAITLDEPEYVRLFGDPESLEALGDAYTWCLRTCLTAIADWCKDNASIEGVSYVFEAGHASQLLADRVLTETNAVSITRQNRRYLSHSFVGKKDACGLQAADLLAWQWATNFKRQAAGKTRRLDFDNLMQAPHSASDYNAKTLGNLKVFLDFRKTEAGKGDDYQAVMMAWRQSLRASGCV